jgi:hypothetical protein
VIVEIRQLEIRLLKVNVCLLRFVILAQWLHIRMMINLDWLSYLGFVLPTAHPALNADHVTGFEWGIAPETWHEQ